MFQHIMNVVVALPLVLISTGNTSANAESNPSASQLEEFLTSGFERRRTSDKEITDQYRDLKRSSEDDTSSEYAYALVLLKRNDYDDAMVVLDELRERSAPVYIPAWKASIWNRLSRREYDEGFSQLTEFARLTAEADRKWSSTDDPQNNARWMGKLLAALGYQLTSGRDWEALQTVWHKVETGLTAPTLQEEFQAGLQDSRRLRKELEGDFSETSEDAAEQQAKADEEKAKELEQKSEAAEKAKDQLKITAEEWKKKLDKELVEFGRQIGSLQRDYAFLDAKRLSLERSITQVQREQTALALAAENNPKGTSSNAFAIESGRLREKLVNYQNERQQTLVGLQQVAAQGTQLLAARQTLINEYQQATGKLVQEDKKLSQLAKKLSKNQEKLEDDDKPVRQSAELRRLRSKMKYFSTYLPFDLEEEKQNLIDSQHPASGD